VFFDSIQNLLGEMKAVPKAPGNDEIRYPGERRKRERDKREEKGIQLSDSVANELKSIAGTYGMEFPEPSSSEQTV
jgi:LDH2 family malate/lactate/ureidoglycolate dehydrogenase